MACKDTEKRAEGWEYKKGKGPRESREAQWGRESGGFQGESLGLLFWCSQVPYTSSSFSPSVLIGAALGRWSSIESSGESEAEE